MMTITVTAFKNLKPGKAGINSHAHPLCTRACAHTQAVPGLFYPDDVDSLLTGGGRTASPVLWGKVSLEHC